MKPVRVLVLMCLAALFALSCAAQERAGKHAGLHPVRDARGKWGFIDKTGRIRIAPRFAEAHEFSDGVAYVWEWEGWQRKRGIVDTNGNLTSLPGSDDEVTFHEGLARVRSPSNQQAKYGYIDKTGRVVIETQFQNAGHFSEGLAWASVVEEGQTHYGFIDKTGKFVVPPQFVNEPGNFIEGLARIQVEDKIGFIDRTGSFRIPPQFQKSDASFSEGLLAAVPFDAPSRGVYVNRDGRIVFDIPLWQQRTQRQRQESEYSWRWQTASFSEGYAPVVSFNKFGFIDKSGQVIISPKFRGARNFSEGLASVSIIGSDGDYIWGYIDRTGNFAVEPQFREALSFAGGLAHVMTSSGSRLLIDHRGKVVWQLSK